MAKEIEQTEGPDWEDDDDRYGGRDISDECSDGDLDSMFGTLNG